MNIKNILKKLYTLLAYLIVISIFCLPIIFDIFHKKFEPLVGVSVDYKKPNFSFKSYNNETYQKNFENYFNKNLTFNYFEIRLFNTVYYYLFKKSYSSKGNIIIGKSHYLLPLDYIDAFLSNKTIQKNEVITFAKDIKNIQSYFNSKHKVFILLITPSKAVFCKDKIPSNYLFLKQDNYYIDKYNNIINQFKNVNINLVDEPTELRNKQINPFLKGGIHQNDKGRFLIADLLIKKINDLSAYNIPSVEVEKIEIDKKAYGEDADYASLLNLFKIPNKYPTPIYTMKKAKPSNREINFVGGSFCWGIVDVLNRANTFKSINIYSYFLTNKYIYNDFKPPKIVDAKNPQKNIKDMLNGDVIVLEINEEVLMHDLGGYHATLFVKEMKKFLDK